MGYQWQKTPHGQYVDGHEREDMVKYWQEVFLSAWAELDKYTRKCKDGKEDIPTKVQWPQDIEDGPCPCQNPTVL